MTIHVRMYMCLLYIHSTCMYMYDYMYMYVHVCAEHASTSGYHLSETFHIQYMYLHINIHSSDYRVILRQ